LADEGETDMTHPWDDAAEYEVDRLAKIQLPIRDEPQAYKRACIRMGYEAAMSSGSEKVQKNANLVLWCVHVLGPDDLLAAPSHEAASIFAAKLNERLHNRANAPDDVLAFAYAAPWPWHDGEDDATHAEGHAECLKDWEGEA
jgi:hypothetical protein